MAEPVAAPVITPIGEITDPTKARVMLYQDGRTVHAPFPDMSGDLALKAPLANPVFTGIVTTAGQIAFPGAQNPSSDANTLDDYEEGTFTPSIVGTSTAGVGTYSGRIGGYTKIGNQVRIAILLTWSAHTGTGNMQISSLPFASGSGFLPLPVISDGLTFANTLVCYTVTASTGLVMATLPAGGSLTPLAMDTGASLFVSGVYAV